MIKTLKLQMKATLKINIILISIYIIGFLSSQFIATRINLNLIIWSQLFSHITNIAKISFVVYNAATIHKTLYLEDNFVTETMSKSKVVFSKILNTLMFSMIIVVVTTAVITYQSANTYNKNVTTPDKILDISEPNIKGYDNKPIISEHEIKEIKPLNTTQPSIFNNIINGLSYGILAILLFMLVSTGMMAVFKKRKKGSEIGFAVLLISVYVTFLYINNIMGRIAYLVNGSDGSILPIRRLTEPLASMMYLIPCVIFCAFTICSLKDEIKHCQSDIDKT